jgi:hypothetical protein
MNGRSLTTLEALNMFGCFRLAARIENLRSQGMDIHTDIVTINDKRVARYSLMRCQQN